MYCSKCGRELKDGEVCNCTTNVEKPTIKFSDTVDDIDNLLEKGYDREKKRKYYKIYYNDED